MTSLMICLSMSDNGLSKNPTTYLSTLSAYSAQPTAPSYCIGTLFCTNCASVSLSVLLLGNTLSRSKANNCRCCWLSMTLVSALSSLIDLTILTQLRSLRYLCSPCAYMVLFSGDSSVAAQLVRNESQDLVCSRCIILSSVFDNIFYF